MPITSEPAPNDPPAGTARIIWHFTNGSALATCGMWALLTGVPDGSDLADLATDLYGVWETNLLGLQHAGVNLVECEVRYWDGTSWISASAFAVHAGGVSGHAITAQAAMLISWGILASYRGGKPRTYIIGVTEVDLQDQRLLTDAKVAALAAAGASFLSDANALTTTNVTSVSIGTVHFFRAGAALAPPTFDPFMTASAQKRVCTQRRRLGSEVF